MEFLPTQKDAAGGLDAYLGDGVVMTQVTSQCCRILWWQPNIDWLITEWTEEIYTLGQTWDGGALEKAKTAGTLFYVAEDATQCGRCYSCAAPGSRATAFSYHQGNSPAGDVMLTHSKQCTNGVSQLIGADNNGNLIYVPCCCNLPNMYTYDANKTLLGHSQYECDACLFIPKFAVYGPNEELWYRVRPDVCCGGMCVNCECSGKNAKCCRIPYKIRDPETRAPIVSSTGTTATTAGDSAFVDLWPGWKAECCTLRDLYSIQFPAGATAAQKATLLGLGHLIDIAINEQGAK